MVGYHGSGVSDLSGLKCCVSRLRPPFVGGNMTAYGRNTATFNKSNEA